LNCKLVQRSVNSYTFKGCKTEGVLYLKS